MVERNDQKGVRMRGKRKESELNCLTGTLLAVYVNTPEQGVLFSKFKSFTLTRIAG